MNRSRPGRLAMAAACLALAIGATAQTSSTPKPAERRRPVKTNAASNAAPMTQEQGKAILEELRQIRQLLEKQQSANFRPQVPTPAAQARTSMNLGDGSYSLGRADAPVTVVEFADYQCPYCRRFHSQTYAQLKKNYIDTGKVRFISRDLPLDFHPNAMPAAEAARCAADQGRFWEMHDALLSGDAELDQDGIEKRAQALSLDMTKFQTCVHAAAFKVAIMKDASDAAALGITGTPTFVIGTAVNGRLDGKRLVGALPYNALEAAIKDALARP